MDIAGWRLPGVLYLFILISAAIGMARTFGNRKSGGPIPVPAWGETEDHANFGAVKRHLSECRYL